MPRLINRIHVNIPFAMLIDSYLDLFLTYGLNPEVGLDAKALENYSLSEFKNVARRLHSKGLKVTVHAPFMDLAPGSPDPEIKAVCRHRFDQVLRLLPLFRPKALVCHTGYDSKRYRPIREAWIESSLELWSWLLEGLSALDIPLMLENVYEHRPEEILPLLEPLAEKNIGFCLDTGHQAAFSKEPTSYWIHCLAPFIRQLHLHDNSYEVDNHLGLGLGKIPFKEVFDQLMEYAVKEPIVTLEPHKEEDLWPSIRYLESLWPW